MNLQAKIFKLICSVYFVRTDFKSCGQKMYTYLGHEVHRTTLLKSLVTSEMYPFSVHFCKLIPEYVKKHDHENINRRGTIWGWILLCFDMIFNKYMYIYIFAL